MTYESLFTAPTEQMAPPPPPPPGRRRTPLAGIVALLLALFGTALVAFPLTRLIGLGVVLVLAVPLVLIWRQERGSPGFVLATSALAVLFLAFLVGFVLIMVSGVPQRSLFGTSSSAPAPAAPAPPELSPGTAGPPTTAPEPIPDAIPPAQQLPPEAPAPVAPPAVTTAPAGPPAPAPGKGAEPTGKQSAGNPPQGPQLTPETCLYGDLSDDGTVACRTPSSTVITSTASLQFTPASGASYSVDLPIGQFTQAGAISILPGALQAATSGAPSEAVVGGATLAGATTGGRGEVYTTALINLATHALTPLAAAGLRPGAGSWTWLSPTELITYRPAGATGGAAGIYLANTNGGTAEVWPQGTPVGLLDQGGATSNSPKPSPSGSPSPGAVI